MRRSALNPLASLGRFSETGLNILVAVADAPKYAYAMLVDIELQAIKLVEIIHGERQA